MAKGNRVRFWIEVGLAIITGILFVLTLITREWIEIIFRVDPDRGSGELEWLVVAILVIATVVFSVLARLEWRKLHMSTG
jgi:hypothetical protein